MLLTLPILIKIFVVSFLLNVVWEFAHCQLYKTCWGMKWGTLTKLLLKMSVKDGIWISIFYFFTFAIFQNLNPFDSWVQTALFVAITLGFAFMDERISVARGRWEYSPKMPLFFGVGLTPLLELAITGLLTFCLVFVIF
ncbi:MAG: hypothetical protein Q8L24_02230 [bacterium]|nr:hypothetical protein [bacterium]